MSKIQVTARRDFIGTLTNTKPIDGIAELIWNGFDADSNHVQVFLQLNDMDGIQSIKVRDFGYGIDYQNVESFFGNLGASWKKETHKQNNRALHGKNGKGRFKAFGLGQIIEWNTTFKNNGKTYSYKIKGTADLLDNFETTNPKESSVNQTGTEVTILNPLKDYRSLKQDNAIQELSKKFAAYLTEYPYLKLEYNGLTINPKDSQLQKKDFSLGEIQLTGGREVEVNVSIIEWKIPTERVLHLCDSKGISLHEIESGQSIRAPGFNFTAYIKSEFFRELDTINQLSLADLHSDVQTILKVAKYKIKEYFRKRLLEHQSDTINRWKKEHIYPYEDKDDLNSIEVAERQVFDILAVNVESYLPKFEEADTKAKKFTFRLLAQAVKDNPDSVQKIIGEVLGLKRSEQDDLAKLLEKTSLTSIISTAKTVADRLNFLNGLETLLFDPEHKKNLLERDQLHKILENEAWIFHEEFALSRSEVRLEEVLNKHLGLLRGEEVKNPVLLADNKTGRIDLLLSKCNQPRTGEYDYLIVELKRPSKKIDSEVITQIKKYAAAVARDERFNKVPAKWTFLAISNEMDDYAKTESNQRHRPRGLIHDDGELNIYVWAKTWSEIINDAKTRLNFINEQLAYQADHESAIEYLSTAHAKFIPDFSESQKESLKDD